MKKISFSLFAIAACLVATNDSAEAQLIRVEPGYVRAPFVRVYRTPGGGRRVRAPFTDVYSPGYAHPGDQGHHQAYVNPYAEPTNDQLGPQERARRQLAAAAYELDRDLSRMVGGSAWQEYLRLPDPVFTGLRTNQPTPIESSVNPDELEHVLARFTQIANDEQYNMISELPSFRTVHQNLVEYLDAGNQPPAPPTPPAVPSHSEEIPLPHPG
ncbi:MAG: hypothetical protein OES09_17675 [Gammaproteobacteria bacterium]|nr:hypothetical protein [Gammaproteobacteria bacterium]